MEIPVQDADPHFFRRWVSVGDVLVMVTTLVVIGISFGTLSARLDAVADEVTIIRGRDITPGAERRISILEVQVAQQRMDSMEWRKEIRDQLDRIEQKMDAHMEGNNGKHL